MSSGPTRLEIEAPPAGKRWPWGLLVVLLLCTVWGLVFIFRSSVVIGETRYFVLFDDAMVSMRYAHNLATGNGLVWNPGETPVEGYTNLGWCLYMALLHLLPVPLAKLSLLVQLSGLLCQLATVVLVWKIGRILSDGASSPALAAAFLSAFYLPLSFWCLFGMEVGLLCLLLCGAVLAALRAIDEHRRSWLPLLCLAAAVIVRLDAMILLVGLTAWLAICDPGHRRWHLRTGALTGLAVVAGQTGFRLLAYGDALPNTYYLKMTGYPLLERVVRGLVVLCDFLWDLNILLVLAPFLLLLWRPSRRLALLAGLVVLQGMYSVWVGGDAWEWWGGANRFLAVVMPLFFLLIAVAGHRLLRQLPLPDLAWAPARPARLAPLLRRATFPALVLLVLVSVNLFTAADSLLMLAQIKPALTVGWAESDIEAALVLEQLTRPEATIAVIWAGTTPYFLDRHCIDLLGKNDRRVARAVAHRFPDRRWTGFFPGHMKWDFAYSIGQLQPDVIVNLWDFTAQDQLRAMGDRYQGVVLRWNGQLIAHPAYGTDVVFFFRKGSPAVRWQRLGTYLVPDR